MVQLMVLNSKLRFSPMVIGLNKIQQLVLYLLSSNIVLQNLKSSININIKTVT